MTDTKTTQGTPATAPHAVHAGCGCGVPAAGTDAIDQGTTSNARKAASVDPDIKAGNINRLRRIEGQVRGLQRMVDEDRYCADILMQIASVQEALRSVGRELMRNHLRHCAAKAIRAGTEEEAEAMYNEILDLVYRHGR